MSDEEAAPLIRKLERMGYVVLPRDGLAGDWVSSEVLEGIERVCRDTRHARILAAGGWITGTSSGSPEFSCYVLEANGTGAYRTACGKVSTGAHYDHLSPENVDLWGDDVDRWRCPGCRRAIDGTSEARG